MSQNRSTIGDVAKAAGVSIATVSRFLADESAVSEDAAKRVKRAVKALNYRSRVSPRRGLAQSLVGLLLPDITNPFFNLLLAGISDAARTHGYWCVVADVDDSPEAEPDALARFSAAGLAGLIAVPVGSEARPFQEFRRGGTPLVLLDRRLEGLQEPSVVCDNEEGAYGAAKYLLKLGHRRIAYLSGPRESSTAQDRLRGYQRALSEAGIQEDSALMVDGNFDQGRACAAVKELIARRVEFTAVFATADVMAFGARRALEEQGIRVPQDVSLVGYDDIPLAAAVSLTTVAQPAREMGRNAFLLLLDVIHGRVHATESMVLRPSLVIRGSCGAARGGNGQ